EQVDIGGERVVFRRNVNLPGRNEPAAFSLPTAAPVASANSLEPAASPDTQQAASIGSSEQHQARVSRYAFGFEWKSLGSVVLDGDGQLVFPNQPALPAIYRFELRNGERER